MATITGTQTINMNKTTTVTWTPLTEADTGTSADISHWPDRTVQVLGTFGGGTIRIEGSIDGGVTYGPLHDPQGNILDFTAAGLKLIAENPQLLRPRPTAGTGVSITVAIHGIH